MAKKVSRALGKIMLLKIASEDGGVSMGGRKWRFHIPRVIL